MSIITHLEDGLLRVGIEIPEQSECNCNPDSPQYEKPIMVIGDSSQDIPWNLMRFLVQEYSLRHRPFILDLLLVNGTPNRYIEVHVSAIGELIAKSVAMSDGKVSDIIHQRATGLQYRFSKTLNTNVLTDAQKFAVTNGIEIAQSGPDE